MNIAIRFILPLSATLIFSAPRSAIPQQPAPSGATLEETIQWLTSKIESYAGGVQMDYDTGWQETTFQGSVNGHKRNTKHIERTNVHATYGPQPCFLHVSWHRSYHWTGQGNADQVGTQQQDTNVLIDIPLYDLKAAVVQDWSDNGTNDKVLALSFNGKKAISHVHGQLQDSEKGDTAISSDEAEDSQIIPFQRDKTQDNVELEGRVASAFNHLRDLCASQKPKSGEPF